MNWLQKQTNKKTRTENPSQWPDSFKGELQRFWSFQESGGEDTWPKWKTNSSPLPASYIHNSVIYSNPKEMQITMGHVLHLAVELEKGRWEGMIHFPEPRLLNVDQVRRFVAFFLSSYFHNYHITGHTDDCFVSISTQTLNIGMFPFPHKSSLLLQAHICSMRLQFLWSSISTRSSKSD